MIMIKILGLVIILQGALSSCSQPKEFPSTVLYNSHVTDFLLQEDSLVTKYNAPTLEVFRFNVRFDRVLFDEVTKELTVKGKVCFDRDTAKCSGIPGVNFFIGYIDKKNLLHNVYELGESSHDSVSIDKNGLFEFKVKIEEGQSLFFSTPDYYLEEYKLQDFFNKD